MDFFSAIGALSDALAADKPVDFKGAAAKLAGPADALSKAFGERAAKVAALAKLPETADLATQRAAFYPLSEVAAEFALDLRREGTGLESVRVFACDMAKGNVPTAPKERGHWIQFNADLRNPWWGAEMLECGAEVRP
jgi:Cu(I)/Ag(I) efflux system membrane fusion protein